MSEMTSTTRMSGANKRFVRRIESSERVDIATIVPDDLNAQRVVLLSSRSRDSDWDLTADDNSQHDSNGLESEDSGFQMDVGDSSNRNRDDSQMAVGRKVS